MTRVRHIAALSNELGQVLATVDKWAWNSAVRASEALVRERARAEGVMYEGDRPSRDGAVYTRRWHGPRGRVLYSTVRVP